MVDIRDKLKYPSDALKRLNPHLFGGESPKKNKYNAQKAEQHDGTVNRTYDSKGERERWMELEALERAGVIKDLRQHPVVELTRDCRWNLDYYYFEVDKGRAVWEDFKGVETALYLYKVNHWRTAGPGLLRITKKKNGKFFVRKEVFPGPDLEQTEKRTA
jgi:hypothetical protein